MKLIQKEGKCDQCGGDNTEVVKVKAPIFSFVLPLIKRGISISVTGQVCQSCVSKAFRSFNKKK